MAVIACTEEGKNLNARISLDGGGCTRTFHVRFNTADDPELRPWIAATNTAVGDPIPVSYAAHPYNAYIYVTDINAGAAGGPFDYRVVVTYARIENPLTAAPVQSWGWASSNEPIDMDKDGDAILNSSREPYDPALSKDVHDQVFRDVRNVQYFDPGVARVYKGAVNSDNDFLKAGDFAGFSAGWVKCTEYSGEPARAGALNYWVLTREFVIRDPHPTAETGWKARVLDQGFKEKTAADTYEIIKGSDGKPLAQPTLLDGSGAVLADAADPVFNFYDLDDTTTFAGLGITLLYPPPV